MTELIEQLSDADIAAETKAIKKIADVHNPPIDGPKFNLCGVEVVVPPLKVKHIVKFTGLMQQLSKFTQDTPADEALVAALPIITAALQRNYPSLTSDDVTELLDLSTFAEVTLAVMGQSGYRKPKPGEK
jgi:poly-beta-hydroxyalkanoate depolymerase